MRSRLHFPSTRVSFLAISALAFGFACFPGARPPDVAPRGTLAPGASDGAAAPDSQAFAVVFASPRGETVDSSEISIVWNRPMRALELAGSETPPPVKMTPEVPGRWNWVGTTAVTFVPEKHLPRATSFVVEVPAGTKALDGSVLDKGFTFRFSTARPAVVSIEPSPGTDDLEPNAKFTLRVNQPVDMRELERAISLTAGDKKRKIDVNITKPNADNDQLFEVRPRSALPLASEVSMEVKDLVGKEGGLRSEKAQQYDFNTYGPLALKEISCDYNTPHNQCAPDGGVSISFTTRVGLGELKKAIKFEPAVKLTFPSWLTDEDDVSNVTVYGAFPAGKKFKVAIAGSLKDQHGQPLGKDVRQDLTFDDLWPKADIGLRGNVFETVARREIPVDAVNANDLELVVAPLTVTEAINLQDDQYSPGRNPQFQAIAALPKAKITKLAPNAAKNATSRFTIKMDDVLGKDARGAVAMGIRYTGWPGSDHARVMGSTAVAKVTDLAITGKISRRGSLLWISRLSNGEPLSGADVTIERPGNAPIGPFRSDASGFVTLPANVFTPNLSETERGVIVVRHGNDWTYKHLEDRLDGWRFDARVDTSEDRPFGLVFTDRGIYRPGDTVHVKGIFRSEGHPGTVTPAGAPVGFKVESPEGETISEQTATLSPFGTASFDVTVPRTGRLGTYSIRANVGDGQTSYAGDASVDFEVAEYRPVEFAVSVESDKPSYIRGDAAKWLARGDYLYGAPMATANARLTVTRSEAYFAPPNTDGFTVDDIVFHSDKHDSSSHGGEVESREAKLDAKGNANIEAKLTLEGQVGPERVTAEADVTDVSRQSVAGSTTAIVHPAEFYIALASGSDLFVDAGKPLEPKVFTVDPKGNRVGNVSVKLELVHRTWEVARKATSGGDTHTVVETVDKVVETCTVTTSTASTPGSCKLTPATSGYHIIHATAVDARKNPIGSSEPLYVFGGSGLAGFGDSDRLAVELVPDRKSYEPGQTARILVKSPFTSAEALVTIERAGILSQKRVQLKGPMPTIEVPITEDYRPNAFVSVMLVRGRTKPVPAKAKDPDVGAPAFRMGYASLPINPEKRRLKIAIAPNKTEAKPGENIEVDLKVTDHQGKPARSEVTFYAVDEGVLSLIGYKTPDPIAVFGAGRPLRVVSLEMREALAHVFRPYGDLGVDKGLDGGDGGGGMSVRRDFRSSATFVPNVITDDSGRAHLSFRLPDTLTTYRLMAVTAAQDDRFGFAENRVVASRQLMARPAMPRFFRAGDSVDAGVIVSSKGTGPMKATVQVKPQGLALREGDTRTVDLPPGTPIEVRFPLSATRAGTAKVGFVVKASDGGKNFEDAVEVTRDVRVPLSPEAVALYGDTTNASAEKLGDLTAIRDDVGGLEVTTSSTALVGLGGGVEQLVEYPYGCTEQLVSKLVPLLPLRELATAFHIPLPKNTDAIIQSTIAQVLKNQRGDGGFGMWADSSEANLWATTYALWGLGEAQRHDVEVPQSVLDDASRYVTRWLERVNDEYGRATAPFILDVLAENGHPDHGRMNRLFEDRKSLPLFGQAFLLHALVTGKGDQKSIDTLVNELEGSLRLDANIARVATNLGDRYAVLMDSDTRTTALVLRAILAAKPNHPIAAKLAMGLLADRKGGTWRNTQETAWSLVALAAYRDAQEKVPPNFLAHIFMGQTEIAKHPFRGASAEQMRTSIPADRLVAAGGSTLAFDVDGSGRLFYEARLRYAPKALPTSALERGFFVQKTLRPVTHETLAKVLAGPTSPSIASFVGGNLVLAEIVVVTPNARRYVVVDDPLPAGFEPVDARLATTAGGLDIDERTDDNDDPEAAFDDDGYDNVPAGKGFFASIYVRELRDDRALFFIDRMPAGMYRYRYLARATTLGSFVLPPTRAEEMYTPEIFGRTAAGTIQVSAK